MSVQIIPSSLQIVSATPILICPGNKLKLFQTSARIAKPVDVNSKPGVDTPEFWSFYWNTPLQNNLTLVEREVNYC